MRERLKNYKREIASPLKHVNFHKKELDYRANVHNLESEKFPNMVICLDGDLGSGKTVFTKGFAQALGIEENITSPTFNIIKEYKQAKKFQVLETKKIPLDIDYDIIPNIASEARDKLKKVKPETISQASRISGVNPSDISILLVYLESRKNNG